MRNFSILDYPGDIQPLATNRSCSSWSDLPSFFGSNPASTISYPNDVVL